MDLPVSGYQEWSDDTVPFICWDRQWTVADIQRRLKCAQGVARHRLMAWLMRELKTSEVWAFLQPTEIQREFEGISRWLDLDGVMRLCAEAIGANLELRRDAPTFRRYRIIRGDDREIVDDLKRRMALMAYPAQPTACATYRLYLTLYPRLSGNGTMIRRVDEASQPSSERRYSSHGMHGIPSISNRCVPRCTRSNSASG